MSTILWSILQLVLHGVTSFLLMALDLEMFDTLDTRAMVMVARQADFDFVIPRTQTFSFRTASCGSGVKLPRQDSQSGHVKTRRYHNYSS